MGGDLELGAMVELNHGTGEHPEYVRIAVYGPRMHRPIVIQRENPAAEDRLINLWFAGGHYQNYDIENHRVLAVPADGNCLFRAVIRGRGVNTNEENMAIQRLRNQVGDYLTAIVRDDPAENPIRRRFEAIFTAVDANRLAEAIAALPPGRLLDEAINLLQGENRESLLTTNFGEILPTTLLAVRLLFLPNSHFKKLG